MNCGAPRSHRVDELSGIDALDEFGLGALHYAAEEGHKGAIEVLLRAGARSDVKDELGKTPAQVAKAWGHIEASIMLGGTPQAATLPKQAQNLLGTAGGSSVYEEAMTSNKTDATLPTKEDLIPENLRPAKLEL